MFYRESGEYKTDYKRDMTLYALPISRFAVGLMVLLFFVAAPLLMSEYQLTLAEPGCHRRCWCTWAEHPGRLRGPAIHWPCRVYVRRGLYRCKPCYQA